MKYTGYIRPNVIAQSRVGSRVAMVEVPIVEVAMVEEYLRQREKKKMFHTRRTDDLTSLIYLYHPPRVAAGRDLYDL